MGAFGFPFGDIEIPYGKTSRYIHIAHQCGKYIRIFAASALPCLNNSIDIYGSASACIDLFGYGIGRRQITVDKLEGFLYYDKGLRVIFKQCISYLPNVFVL